MAADGIFEYFKMQAKAEKELEVERWAVITFESKKHGVLWRYDLPVHLYERWEWVIRWREARLVCQYPKDNIRRYYCPYYKRKGLYMGYSEDFGTLVAAKAQVTKAKNAIERYLEYKHGDLFFDENTDEELQKAKRKLAQKMADVEAAEQRMIEKYNEAVNRKQNGSQIEMEVRRGRI